MNKVSRASTVEVIPCQDLCTSCGICAGVCPAGAVSLQISPKGIWIPIIDKAVCVECGICLKSCAGHGFNFGDHYLALFGALPEHPEVGNFQAIYSGYALDNDLRWQCQSGGMVSTLLLFLLNHRIIDGAVVTRWNSEHPLSAEPFIARTPSEILQAAGSKYCPVPVGEVLTEVLKQDGTFAFVGTPCQIQSLRKAERLVPKLLSKIYVRLGLYCLNVFTLHFHEYVLKHLGISSADVKRFAYRSKAWRGWPCDMRIEMHSGQVYDWEGRYSRLAPRPFFSAWRCQLCIDKLNEFADISFGDCRIPRHYEAKTLEEASYRNNPGKSDVIVRSDRGYELIDAARREGLIALSPTNWEEIISTTATSEKKLGYSTFSRIATRARRGVPFYGVTYVPARETERAHMNRTRVRFITLSFSLFDLFSDQLRKHHLYRSLLQRMRHSLMEYLNLRRQRHLSYCKFRNSPLRAMYTAD